MITHMHTDGRSYTCPNTCTLGKEGTPTYKEDERTPVRPHAIPEAARKQTPIGHTLASLGHSPENVELARHVRAYLALELEDRRMVHALALRLRTGA